MRSLALVAADERGAIAEREADAAAEVPSYLDAGDARRDGRRGRRRGAPPRLRLPLRVGRAGRGLPGRGARLRRPSPDALATLGRKDAARELAQRAGVPVVPGGADAGEIGYPLLVKARAGGGGRGMRVVRERRGAAGRRRGRRHARPRRRSATAGSSTSATSTARATSRCRSCATPTAPASTSASATARSSAATRRSIEEAPAPGVGRELRGELGAAALRLAEAVGYVGAGTAEFLLAPDGNWYFLEMNARIQVEHPVTELVTSIDIVRRQLEIAAGRPLELEQGDVLLRGHALEARIYAEDADHGFLPTSGTVLAVRWPRGPGMRVDAGVDGGDVVGTRYDGLLAKLCVHGETRARALARLRAALDDVVVLGLTTNLPLLRSIAREPGVRARRRRYGLARAHLAAAARATAPPAEAAGSRRGLRRAASRARVPGRAAGAPACGRRRPAPRSRAPPTARCTSGSTAATFASSARLWPSPSGTPTAPRAPRRRALRASPPRCRGRCCGSRSPRATRSTERGRAARARGDEDGAPRLGALRRAHRAPRLPRGPAGRGRRRCCCVELAARRACMARSRRWHCRTATSPPASPDSCSGGIVVAILAAGLARGQDNWRDALVRSSAALLEVTAIAYATSAIWFALAQRSGARSRARGVLARKPTGAEARATRGLERRARPRNAVHPRARRGADRRRMAIAGSCSARSATLLRRI